MNREFLESLIGKSIDEARSICIDSNISFRVVREDETNYIVTMDLRSDRINVEIDNGIITNVNVG